MKTIQSNLLFQSVESISGAYFAGAPLAHALFRTAELGNFTAQPLERPILDLGCGAGEFARMVLREPLECGIDLSARQLRRAARTGKYLQTCQGDARNMPFADASFACVLSISVLEHIAEPARVVSEAYRVLRPGGVFVGTLVLHDLRQHLFYSGIFQRIGLRRLANFYVHMHDRLFKHKTMLSEETWRGHWQAAGFEIELCRRVVSPRVTRLWDLLLPFALPYWLARKIGLNFAWHPRWLPRRLQKVLTAPDATGDHEGSCLFFVLRKPDRTVAESWDGDPTSGAVILQRP